MVWGLSFKWKGQTKNHMDHIIPCRHEERAEFVPLTNAKKGPGPEDPRGDNGEGVMIETDDLCVMNLGYRSSCSTAWNLFH